MAKLTLALNPNAVWNNAAKTSFDVNVMLGNTQIRTTIVNSDPNFTDGVLVSYGSIAAYVAPVIPPPSKEQLQAYLSQKAAFYRNGGVNGYVTYNVAAAGQPAIDCDVSFSADDKALLLGSYSLAQSYIAANNPTPFPWENSNGLYVSLTAQQVVTLYNNSVAYIQSIFNVSAAYSAAITSGAITTTAQIDTPQTVSVGTPPAPLPAWPTS